LGTALVARHGLLEDLLGLRVAPVPDVHLGFRDRIDLVRVDGARSGLVEVGEERAIARVYESTAWLRRAALGLAVGGEGARHRAAWPRLSPSLSSANEEEAADDRAEAHQSAHDIRPAVDHLVDEARLGRRRGFLRRGGFRRRGLRSLRNLRRFGLRGL